MKYLFDAILLEKKTIAVDKYEYVFGIEDADFRFRPGQYVWLALPQMEFYDPTGSRRAFSIASPPSRTGQISIIFKGGQSGYKKSLLAYPVQAKVQLIGPFGSAFTQDNLTQPEVVIIAGGTGIAPFLSILQTPEFFRPEQHVTVIHLNSSPERAVYVRELPQFGPSNKTIVQIIGDFSWEKSTLDERKIGDSVFCISGQQPTVDGIVSVLSSHGVSSERMVFGNVYPTSPESINKQQLDELTSSETNVGLMVMEQSTQHIVITDVNGVILFVNQSAQQTTEFTKEEMVSNTPRLWGAMMNPPFYRELWGQLKQGQPFIGQLTNRKKNGELYYVISHISPLFDKAKGVIGFIATEEDITRRVLLERLLAQQSQQNLEEKRKTEAILQSIGDGIVALDQEGKIILFNVSAAALTGLNPRAALGRPYKEVLKIKLDEDGSKDEFFIAMALKGNPVEVGSPCYLERLSGEKIPLGLNAVPILTASKEVTGVVVVLRNITKELQADRLKDEFVLVASHELRTPLTAIDGIVSMILEGEYGNINENLAEPLKDINQSSERLIHLVNDLLSLSRIQAGKLKFVLADFSLPEKLRQVADLMRPLAVKKNLSLSLGEAPDLTVQADIEKFEQVLDNVIGNAIKFTDRGGVTLTAAINNDRVEIFITDTGIGIAKADQAKLFGKFEQFNSEGERPPGTGLGLFVSLGIAQKMGGNLWLANSEPGRGSTFVFSVPIAHSTTADTVKAELATEAGKS